MDKRNYYTREQLRRRGWTNNMIIKYLPQTAIINNKTGNIEQMYLKSNVHLIEQNSKIKAMISEPRPSFLTEPAYERDSASKQNQFAQHLPQLLALIYCEQVVDNYFLTKHISRSVDKLRYIFEYLIYYDDKRIGNIVGIDKDYILQIAALVKITHTYPQLEKYCKFYIGEIIDNLTKDQ